MTNKNDVSWTELCSYVEKEIFNYDENQKLQKKACLILRGLTNGQNVANNNCEKFGNYSYEIILTAFKINKIVILNSIKNKDFNSEENKMSYVAAIIRNKINDVYERVKNSKKTQEKAETVNIDAVTYDGAIYKKRTNDTVTNKRLEDLW